LAALPRPAAACVGGAVMSRPPLHIAMTHQPKTTTVPMKDTPAAQARKLILAYRKAADEVPHRAGLAAALRDAADQVVPEGGVFLSTASAPRIRRDLLAIAAALERQS